MAYLGNTPTQQAFTPATDYFSGNGSTTAFTLSRPVASVNQVVAVVNNVDQDPASAYTVSGNTITFTSAPSSGTNNIYVRYTSPITQVNALSQSPAIVGDVNASGGLLSAGSFNSAFIDGTVVDYTSGAGRISVGSSDSLVFYRGGVANTESMRLDSSGNLGLGVTPPSLSTNPGLFIGGNQGLFGTSGVQVGFGTNIYNNAGTWKYVSTAAATLYQPSSGTHAWYYAPSGTAGTSVSFTQAMTLDASGNLGIGLTSPSYRLHNRSGNGNIALTNSSIYPAIYGFDSNGSAENFVIEAYALRFRTGGSAIGSNTERMVLDSDGYLQAHAGTGALSNPTYHSFRTGTSSTTWVMYQRHETSTAGNAYGTKIEYRNVAPNGTGNEFLFCSDMSATRATIRSNGGLANYSANNVNLSDERTKTDIELAGNYLDKICAIPVKTFKYKDQTDDELNLGVIAQDVEAVAPELVDVSGFGETPEDGVPLKAIYQTDLQYALMKCIQEQQEIINDLKARIETLEAK